MIPPSDVRFWLWLGAIVAFICANIVVMPILDVVVTLAFRSIERGLFVGI
jgi:hypothetical protein